MCIGINPLQVDVGRKKSKADARYSLTSACLGLCLSFKMIRATAPFLMLIESSVILSPTKHPAPVKVSAIDSGAVNVMN